MRRVIAWAVGIAAMTGVSAAMLMTTVPGDRGRDEINLVTIHELPLPSGGVLTQEHPSIAVARGLGPDVEFMGAWDLVDGQTRWTAISSSSCSSPSFGSA